MAKRLSQPNGYLSNVWDIAADTYDHNDIKGWLDTIDRLLGQLYSDRFIVGEVIGISGPSLSGTPDSNPIVIPNGWGLCDGRTVTAANHDFPAPYAGNTIHLPDYRGRILIGADSAITPGTPGTVTVSPGVKGRQGSNTSAIPDHFHIHDHTHGFGGNDAIETEIASANIVSNNATGGAANISRQSHTHALLRQNTSKPEASINPDAFTSLGEGGQTLQTTTQILKTSGTQTTPVGAGGAGDDINVDVRQSSEGIYWIMKIKKYAGSATP